MIIFSFGYPQSVEDIQKMKVEYDKYKKGTLQETTRKELQFIDPVTGLPRETTIYPFKPLEEKVEKEKIELKYFFIVPIKQLI